MDFGQVRPNYCGGFVEVAKGLWIKRGDLDLKKLAEYTKRLGVGAVASRLAYLLELYGAAGQRILDELRLEFAPLRFVTTLDGSCASTWTRTS